MNLGEWLGTILLEGLGCHVQYHARGVQETETCLMVVGSSFYRQEVDRLLGEVPELWAWGTGNGYHHAKYLFNVGEEPYRSRVKVFALRGPLTAARSGVSGVPLCDPVFALPRVLPLRRSPSREILYVPHWQERSGAEKRLAEIGATHYVDVMLIRKQLLPVVQRIIDARFVLTSTLHTVILCLAYDVPWALYLSPGMADTSMPLKWRDLFASMGSRRPKPVRDRRAGWRWWLKVGRFLRPPDTDALLASFPYGGISL